MTETALIETLADGTYGQADFRSPFADPLVLARANGFLVCATLSKLRCWAAYGSQVLYYSPFGGQRQRGDIVYHDLAHGLLFRYGIEHSHGDVYNLALALMAPRHWIAARIRGRGARDTMRLLVRSNRHAPVHLLRLRVQSVWTEIEASRSRGMQKLTL